MTKILRNILFDREHDDSVFMVLCFMFFVHDDKRNKMMIDDTGRTPSVDPFLSNR